MGRRESFPLLVRMLRDDPAVEVIDAVFDIADEPIIVTLGRIVQRRPDLAHFARSALAVDHGAALTELQAGGYMRRRALEMLKARNLARQRLRERDDNNGRARQDPSPGKILP
jgi:hypothetical protein